MPRNSLLDKIHNRNFDKVEETQKIYKIIDADASLRYYLGMAYLESEYSTFKCDFRDSYKSLFENAINSTDIDDFLDFLEFITNLLRIVHENKHRTDRSVQLKKNILESIKLAGYKFYDDKNGYFKSGLINEKAEIVAENVKLSVKDHIYEYLTIRNGDTASKRNTIKNLCDDVELFCKNSSDNNIKKLKQFYQCVRHTKDNPIKEFPFYYDNEEKWLDNIFDMIIDALAMEDLNKKVNEIIKQENESSQRK